MLPWTFFRMQTINNYWVKLSKISWFVSGKQINYLPKPKAEANNWSQIMIFCNNRSSIIIIIVLSFDHRCFDQLNMSNHYLPASRTDPPFSHKSIVSITHEQSIICNKTLICRQLFAGHLVSSQPMKKKEK